MFQINWIKCREIVADISLLQRVHPSFRKTAMTRFILTVIAFVVGSTLLENPSAAESQGIGVLTVNNSPLAKGEVIAFFGDSITQGGARPGGYCRLIATAIENPNWACVSSMPESVMPESVVTRSQIFKVGSIGTCFRRNRRPYSSILESTTSGTVPTVPARRKIGSTPGCGI